MKNDFCHLELQTSDLKAAKEFYGELFDWELHAEQSEQGEYTMIRPGAGPGGGMFQMPGEHTPRWVVYIQVPSVDEYMERARQLGATVIWEKTKVEEMGSFAALQDPQGAVFSIWETNK